MLNSTNELHLVCSRSRSLQPHPRCRTVHPRISTMSGLGGVEREAQALARITSLFALAAKDCTKVAVQAGVVEEERASSGSGSVTSAQSVQSARPARPTCPARLVRIEESNRVTKVALADVAKRVAAAQDRSTKLAAVAGLPEGKGGKDGRKRRGGRGKHSTAHPFRAHSSDGAPLIAPCS